MFKSSVVAFYSVIIISLLITEQSDISEILKQVNFSV